MAWKLVWQTEVWREADAWPHNRRAQLEEVLRYIRRDGPNALSGVVRTGALGYVAVDWGDGRFGFILEIIGDDLIIIRRLEYFEH